MEWKADWIWYPGAADEAECYFWFGKKVIIDQIKKTMVSITAWTDYVLYLNGREVGRGPDPSSPRDIYYDTYEVQDMLKEGENQIIILAHNYRVGVHWQPAAEGGMIFQMESENLLIKSDASFRTKRAEMFMKGSPRMMWSCQFLESLDLSKTEETSDTEGWVTAKVMGIAGRFPFLHMREREIPRLEYGTLLPQKKLRYHFRHRGIQCVSLRGGEWKDKEGLCFLSTQFSVEEPLDTALFFSCDDACRVYLDNELILKQEYEDDFVRHAVWNGRHDYEQFHYGVGMRREQANISLDKGVHKIQVIVDKIQDSWGFILGIMDIGNPGGRWNAENPPLFLEYEYEDWKLWDCRETDGLKNSLHPYDYFPEIENKYRTAGESAGIDGYNYENITDYFKLMRAEERVYESGWEDRTEQILLSGGGGIILDLGRAGTGRPVLELECTLDAVMDVAYTNILQDDGRPFAIWQMRYADRFYIPVGLHTVKTYERRECRYLYISVQKGALLLNKVFMQTVGYPVSVKADFSCSDPDWEKLWKTSVYTSGILMQDSYQDCLKRECGVHNTRSFIHAASAAYYCFGDSKLIRKNLLDGIRTQEDSGWFSSHGPTDTNADEATQMLWWFQVLEGYLMRTGDKEFLIELYEKIKCVLRYFSHQENNNLLLDCRNETREVRGRYCYIDDSANVPPYVGLFDGVLLGFNVLYYRALCIFSKLSEWIGREKEARFYAVKASALKTAVNDTFWDTESEIYRDYVEKDGTKAGISSQAILLTALYCGVCDAERSGKVMDYVLGQMKGADSDFVNSRLTFGFYYFFLKLLLEQGRDLAAKVLIDDYYVRWLHMGATTFGEYFELKDFVGKEKLDMEYNTHNYGTSLHELFYTRILGVEPAEYGFEKIRIAPSLLGLQHANGRIYTDKGMIYIAWNRKQKEMKLAVDVPKGMETDIIVPAGFETYHVVINGKESKEYKIRGCSSE